jgi:MFS family permease
MDPRRRTVALLNVGHAVDHLFMLIFPTAVLAMSGEFGLGYGDLLPLSLGGFIAFGAGSIPAGWLGDRWSRHGMMTVFFAGIGAAAILTGFARTPMEIAVGLTLIGTFAAIYHPVGIAMLVASEGRVGRVLGVNGVWGNLGVAAAAILTGFLVDTFGWRAAFFIPGVIAVGIGVVFWRWVPDVRAGAADSKKPAQGVDSASMVRVFSILVVATVCGGVIFNATTISMPKVFDERLTQLTSTNFGIGTLVALVYVLAAMAQLCVGWAIDRFSLARTFLPVALLQAPLLYLAVGMENGAMLVTATAMMFVVFGQIPINDTMIAKYVDDRWRSRAYAVRYVMSFGASAAAVPLVAILHAASGGFARVFEVLALVALGTAAAALWFPKAVPSPAGPVTPASQAPAA